LNRVVKYLLLILLAGLIMSCKEDYPKKYFIKENFRVIAGAQTGLSGISEYVIDISAGINPKDFTADNFAKNFKIKIAIEGDSLIIPNQTVPFSNNQEVTIMGKGFFRGDSLFYEYFSGGPGGQITASCTGIKK
jgi:hypothetical protein